jgi:hypothetical protein
MKQKTLMAGLTALALIGIIGVTGMVLLGYFGISETAGVGAGETVVNVEAEKDQATVYAQTISWEGKLDGSETTKAEDVTGWWYREGSWVLLSATAGETLNQTTKYSEGDGGRMCIDSTASYTAKNADEACQEFTVMSTSEDVPATVYAVASESSLTTAGYDKFGSSLSTSTTGDYYVTIGASEDEETVDVYLDNNQDDKIFALCAYAYGWAGNISEVELSDSDWEDISMLPDELDDTDYSYTTPGGSSLTMEWKGVYRLKKYKEMPEDYILEEYETLDDPLRFIIKGNTVGPGAEDTVVCLQALDCGQAIDNTQQPTWDFYVHDDNERHSEVGVAEDESSPNGLTSGACFEIR